MRVLIDINHPAHVHLFRHFAIHLMRRGHSVLFTARDKEVSFDLLRAFDLPYVGLGSHRKSLVGKLVGLAQFDYRMWRAARKFRPDVVVSMASMYAAHAAFLVGRPHVALEDSEPVMEHQILYVPFTAAVLTPRGLKRSFGKKQIRYDGFHELAYLHPKYFVPDPSIRQLLGVGDEPYALLRFAAFRASHDAGKRGLTTSERLRAVRALEQHGRVLITSESELEGELRPYGVRIPPSRLHDAMAFASVYLGDSQTMATEAAVLGVPAVRCNSFAKSPNEMSNFVELEERYGLLFNFHISQVDAAIATAARLTADSDAKRQWAVKRDRLLKDKIDVTAYLVWFVENYPASVRSLETPTRGAIASASNASETIGH